MRYGIGLLWNCSRNVSPFYYFQRYYMNLIYSSIVEINISIQVACMPACASCFRHFASKLHAFFVNRFLDTETSNKCSMPSESEVTENVAQPKWYHASRDRRTGELRGKEDGIPQTTSSSRTSAGGFPCGNFTSDESNALQKSEGPMPKRPDDCFQAPQRPSQSEYRV